MVMATRRQRNVASPSRQHPAKLRGKRNEMRFEIPLQMRQVAPIELHTRILSRRDKSTCVKDGVYKNAFPQRESRRGGRIRPPRERSERPRDKSWYQPKTH